MLKAFKQSAQKRYRQWLNRRIPRMRSVTLNQRRIFIFPSRAGRWFLVLLLVMLIAAINYQNNMAFALVFLLFSVFIVTVLHTFSNLSGLTISALPSAPVFAGDNAEFKISVSRGGTKEYFDVNFSWPESEVCSVTLTEHSEQQLQLHLPVIRRGRYQPERLLLETFYPLGLMRAWTWLALDIEVVVYPQPLPCSMEGQAGSDDNEEGEVVAIAGSDDFYAFKHYQPGDSLKHVFWKSYAKEQTLQTKQFASYRDQRLWLDWDQFQGDTESRLSKLCYWVLTLERSNDEYGLRLPGLEIAPGYGEQHQQQLLTALALYNTGEGQ